MTLESLGMLGEFVGGLAVLVTWLLMAKIFKISSLSALTAATLNPLYLWLIEDSIALVIMGCIMSVLLIIRHHSNIRNLLSGKESKI